MIGKINSTLLRNYSLFIGSVFLALVSGCSTLIDNPEKFRFPILHGSVDDGRESFVELECHQCHTVQGVSLPEFGTEYPIHMPLGGEIYYAKTYQELLTSIINPNHVVSTEYLAMLPQGERRNADTPMPFKGHMTVQQLVDIVTFLNSRYVLMDGYQLYYDEDEEY